MRKLEELKKENNDLVMTCDKLSKENEYINKKIKELQTQSGDEVENAFEIVFGDINVGNIEFGGDSILTSARLDLRGDFKIVSNFIQNLLKLKTR